MNNFPMSPLHAWISLSFEESGLWSGRARVGHSHASRLAVTFSPCGAASAPSCPLASSISRRGSARPTAQPRTESDQPSSAPADAILRNRNASSNGSRALATELKRACHNQGMGCSAHRSSQLISLLEALLDGPTGLAWLRSIARRQASQPWQPIKCGPSMEPASVHIKCFRDQWAGAVRRDRSRLPRCRLRVRRINRARSPPPRFRRRHQFCPRGHSEAERPTGSAIDGARGESRRVWSASLNSQERAWMVTPAFGTRVR
jgi:hypothetical protein